MRDHREWDRRLDDYESKIRDASTRSRCHDGAVTPVIREKPRLEIESCGDLEAMVANSGTHVAKTRQNSITSYLISTAEEQVLHAITRESPRGPVKLLNRNVRRMAERVGFEPTCRLPDKTLSRRPRYDHFGTSPSR